MGTLTSSQLSALQTWINQNQAANAAAGSITPIQAALNATDPSNTIAYNPQQPTFGPGGLFGALVYSDFIVLTSAQQNYFLMLMSQPSFDATNSNIDTAIGTMFNGKQTLTNFGALARKGTVFEVLCMTSHVVAAGASGQSLYGYQVSQVDVQAAIAGSY